MTGALTLRYGAAVVKRSQYLSPAAAAALLLKKRIA